MSTTYDFLLRKLKIRFLNLRSKHCVPGLFNIISGPIECPEWLMFSNRSKRVVYFHMNDVFFYNNLIYLVSKSDILQKAFSIYIPVTLQECIFVPAAPFWQTIPKKFFVKRDSPAILAEPDLKCKLCTSVWWLRIYSCGVSFCLMFR